VAREQALRDERDASADRSVHEPAPDAVPVDTTGLTLEEVVDQIVALAVEAREVGA
jgi:cytidylate kinase